MGIFEYFLPDNPIVWILIVIMIWSFLSYWFKLSRFVNEQIEKLNQLEKNGKDLSGTLKKDQIMVVDEAINLEYSFEVEVDKIERKIEQFRVVTSWFLVLGVLGTLIGISDSFAKLSPIVTHNITPQNLTSNLAELFLKLKNAFAPSIWGVSLTIMSLFLLRHKIIKLDNSIVDFRENVLAELKREVTQTKPAQKALIQELRIAVRRFTEISEINKSVFDAFTKDVEELRTNLSDLNKVIKISDENLKTYNKMIEKIQNILNEVGEIPKYLRENYDRAIYEFKKVSADIGERFMNIADRVDESAEKFYNFEEKFTDTLDRQIRNFKSLYEEISMSIEGRDKNILDIGQSIKDGFADLKILMDKFENMLRELNQELKLLGDPLKDSADKIDISFRNFVNFATEDLPKSAQETNNLLSEIAKLLKNNSGSTNGNRYIELLVNETQQINRNIESLSSVLKGLVYRINERKTVFSYLKTIFSRKHEEKRSV